APMSQFPAVQFLTSASNPTQFPPDRGWEVAVAGRSNCGKSSAINALLGRHGLARTSRTPGRTQLYNYFELAAGKRMVDLPGYGHASVPGAIRATWGPMADALRQRESFGAVLLVVDCRRGVGELDLALVDWADQSPEQTHILLSKADKLPSGQAKAALREAEAVLQGLASCQLFSANKGTGVDSARAVLRRWLAGKKEITPAGLPPGQE
ncbi:MAG: ribosome biogenesis GTP-binding protein YihA/YsxC, partial [Pseudomonadota bacterium]